jgi:hypothetical protein
MIILEQSGNSNGMNNSSTARTARLIKSDLHGHMDYIQRYLEVRLLPDSLNTQIGFLQAFILHAI